MRTDNKLLRKQKEEKLLFFARKHLGKPYKYGARPWQAPLIFDCYSFVQYLYKRVGVILPRVSIEQARHGKKTAKNKLQSGDLIFIKGGMGRYNKYFPEGIGHVAMYVGNGKVIHAEGVKYGKVTEEPLDAFLKRSKITVIKRYL